MKEERTLSIVNRDMRISASPKRRRGGPASASRSGRSALKVIKRYAFLAVKRASYLPRILRRDRFGRLSRPRRDTRANKKKTRRNGEREGRRAGGEGR